MEKQLNEKNNEYRIDTCELVFTLIVLSFVDP